MRAGLPAKSEGAQHLRGVFGTGRGCARENAHSADTPPHFSLAVGVWSGSDKIVMLQLSRMSSLETLDVSYCPMGNAELVTIAAGCPNLVYMNLDGCWISTLCMLGVVRRRPALRLWHTGTLEHGPIKVPIRRCMSPCAC